MFFQSQKLNRIVSGIILAAVVIPLGVIAVKLFDVEKKLTHKIQESSDNIDVITSGMNLDETRLRKVLQTQKMIAHFNSSLSVEFNHSLAMIIVDVASKYPNMTHMDLVSLIGHESRFDPNAKSTVGARGLTQLMPSTAEYVCDKFAWAYVDGMEYDVEKNVMMGAYYYNKMLEKNRKDKELALSEYNGGEKMRNRYSFKRIKAHGGVLTPEQMIEINYLTTENAGYPAKVNKVEKELKRMFKFNMGNK